MTSSLAPSRKSLLRPLAVLAIVLILLAATGTAIIRFTFVGPFLGFRPREIDEAAQLILAGTLKPDPSGMITLPPALASATFDGKAYITTPLKGAASLMVFKVFPGKGSNFSGYVHSTTTLPPGMVYVARFGGGSTLDGRIITNDSIGVTPLGGAWYRAYSSWD